MQDSEWAPLLFIHPSAFILPPSSFILHPSTFIHPLHLLPPEAERFLRRAVGKAEQYAIGFRLEAMRAPRWDHEDVVRGKCVTLRADLDRTVALDHVEHRAVGAAVA